MNKEMNKLFNILFISLLVVAVSCSDDDGFDSSVTTTPKGYLSTWTSTVQRIDDDEIQSESETYYFSYDSKKRLKNVSCAKTEELTNGGSSVSSYTCTITYDGNEITSYSFYEDVTTEYNVSSGKVVEDVSTTWGTDVLVAALSDNGILQSMTQTSSSSSYIYVYDFYSANNTVLSYERHSSGSQTSIGSVLSWVDGNMTTLGDDRFEYGSLLNNCNIDLNMFVTNSEEFDLFGDILGVVNDIKGIHSVNMISSCEEEDNTYDIIYTTDDDGKITQAKFDKYGDGSYCRILDFTYY